MNSWAIAYSFKQMFQAEMAIELLKDNDIEAVIMNKQDSAYLFGDIELYTKPEHVIRSKHLISKLLGLE